VYDRTAGIPAVIEEVSSSGVVYYVREPGGELVASLRGGSVYYYHFDGLGSTRAMTDSAGNVTDTYTYDAWGNVTSHIGPTSQPYQFVGQLGYYTHCQEPNLGLMLLGVRFYGSEVGRFTQRGSPYTYSGNNPVAIQGIGDFIVLLPPFRGRNPDEVDADIREVGYMSTLCALRSQREAQGLCERHYNGRENVWGDTLANAVMHCTLTCTMAAKCGRDVARTITNNHEKYNWNDKTGPMDLANNKEGLNCFDWAPRKCRGKKRNDVRECFDCCEKRRASGNLHLLPKTSVRTYPGGN